MIFIIPLINGFGEAMANALVVILLIAILSFSVFRIVKAKKNGKTCMGCPSFGSCNKPDNCNRK